MEDQEREYLMEQTRWMEEWEETPLPPSGIASDLTEMGKEIYIDRLLGINERLASELAKLRQEISDTKNAFKDEVSGLKLQLEESNSMLRAAEDQRTKAEARAEELEDNNKDLFAKVNRLLELVERLQNGSELRLQRERADKAEKELAELRAAERTVKGQIYGTKSQKSRKNKDDEGHTPGVPDPEDEKNNMGGKSSVAKLPEADDAAASDTEEGKDSWVEKKYRSKRVYREGMKHRTMKAARRCVHESDRAQIPDGWTVVREEKRFVYDKMTVMVEHEYQYYVARNAEGDERVFYCPKAKGEEKWTISEDNGEREVAPLAPAAEEMRDRDGNPVIDCFPGTHATSGMMAQLAVDHFVNNIPYYRLTRYFRDNGMSVCRQTLINWLDEGGRTLKKLIPVLLDTAVEKDSIVNCDETWCKVRVRGRYMKRYIWCLVNKEQKIVIYFYKEGARSRNALKDILGDREPQALQSDGYNVYLYLDDELIDIEHLCCMAHARARFFYAWQTYGEADAEYILQIIRELYRLEDHYQKLGLTPDRIKMMRNGDYTSSLIIRLRSKIDSMKGTEHPPRSEMLEKAVRYMDDFWLQLFAYRKDGRYSIDNTIAERFMRPVSGERKNSLFYGSGRMAETASVYRTLISTCRLMKVSVCEYFHKVFRQLVSGCDNMANLLPMNIGLAVNKY